MGITLAVSLIQHLSNLQTKIDRINRIFAKTEISHTKMNILPYNSILNVLINIV